MIDALPTDNTLDLVIFSMALSIAFAGFSIRLSHLGCGIHMWDMKFADYSPPYMAVCIAFAQFI
jgi:hypothetical protein